MTPIFTGLLLASALGALAAPPSKTRKMERPAQTVVDSSFEILAPGGWRVERRPNGAILTGPTDEGLPARIIVRWVSPDHQRYGTAEAYMAQLSKPSSMYIKGWKNSAVETVAAAGRKALRLERDTTEYVPPESISPKEVLMREEHLAVPAAKGFYLLIYTAPRSLDAAQRLVFRRLIEKGFKPKL